MTTLQQKIIDGIEIAIESIQPQLNEFFKEGEDNLIAISEFVEQYALVISSLIRALKLDMRAFPSITKWSDTGDECFGIVDIAPLKPTPAHIRTLQIGTIQKTFDDVYSRIVMMNDDNIFYDHNQRHAKGRLIKALSKGYQSPDGIVSSLLDLARDNEKTLDGLKLLYGLRGYDVTEYDDLMHPYFDEAFHDYHKHYKTPMGKYEIIFHSDEFSPCGLPSFLEFEVKS
jgi:hypothetical protein